MFEINNLLTAIGVLFYLGLIILSAMYIMKGYKKYKVFQKRQSFRLIKGEDVEPEICSRHKRNNN